MSKKMLRRLALGLAGLLAGTGAGLGAGLGAAWAVTAPILVVEVDSGKVIYAQGATDPWYPASITKLMTTYVALDLVRQGKVSLDTLLTISPEAAAEPPSKMGFKPGTQLTLDNALKIIMVKSANDVAHAIGENLGGSMEGFAALMNATAQRIGMRESRWFNANGLPDPRQWTSARDMGVLGRALLRDFPEQHGLFSISAIQFGRAIMPNHNGLLGRYAGADGMKTGFICSGGFNVVASATRNGRRILTVVMGQPSARERDLKAADLFDLGFAQGTNWTSQSIEAMPASSIGEPPDMRPYICDRRKPMPTDSGQSAVVTGTSPDTANAQLVGASAAPATALAFAAISGTSMRNRALPPRAPLQPVQVWVGRSQAEGQQQLTAQEAEAQAAQAAARTARLEAIKAKREAARQAKAEAAQKSAARKAAPAPAPKAASAYAATEDAPAAGKAVPSAKAVHSKAARPAAKSTAKSTAKSAAKPANAPKAQKPAAKDKAAAAE